MGVSVHALSLTLDSRCGAGPRSVSNIHLGRLAHPERRLRYGTLPQSPAGGQRAEALSVATL